MKKPLAKDFKDMLKAFLNSANKTSYGKKELILLIEELYSAFLDSLMEE